MTALLTTVTVISVIGQSHHMVRGLLTMALLTLIGSLLQIALLAALESTHEWVMLEDIQVRAPKSALLPSGRFYIVAGREVVKAKKLFYPLLCFLLEITGEQYTLDILLTNYSPVINMSVMTVYYYRLV